MTKKTKSKAKRKKKNQKKNRAILIIASVLAVIVIIGAIYAFTLYKDAYRTFDGEDQYTLIIPKQASQEQICDSLYKIPNDYGKAVYRMWKLRDGEESMAPGVYFISPGDRAWSVAGRIVAGRSSAVRVTFNNVRLMKDLAKKLAGYFLWEEADFLTACDSLLTELGYSKNEFPALFLPNTYEFYASAEPDEVIEKLMEYYDNFWTDERIAKAKSLGLSPVEVSTVASIIEEESNNTTERPVIARLYLNRLHKGMRLQADPTVKFGIGDFSIRRLNGQHLRHESPFNTYLHAGLPPGPIRIPESASVDAVLNAPNNDYIYMCAKPDHSGTHNFTDNYEDHKRNAAAYQRWLDQRGITH